MTRRRPSRSAGRRPGASRCRSCEETVLWCETESGKSMPVDLEPVENGNLRITPRGPQRRPLAVVVPAGERRTGQRLHVSHFAHCKGAKNHRRDKKPQRQAAAPEQGELFGPAPARGSRR